MWRPNFLEKTLVLGRMKAGKGDDRGWDGWMASLTQRIWMWASSGRWWRTETPGMLQAMGSQTVGHCLATEQQKQGKMIHENWNTCHTLIPTLFFFFPSLLLRVQPLQGWSGISTLGRWLEIWTLRPHWDLAHQNLQRNRISAEICCRSSRETHCSKAQLSGNFCSDGNVFYLH